jgi:hypothetical protein
MKAKGGGRQVVLRIALYALMSYGVLVALYIVVGGLLCFCIATDLFKEGIE